MTKTDYHFMSSNTRGLAVLIDGDSVKPEYFERVLVWAARNRTVKIRRIYGGCKKLSTWEKCIDSHEIESVTNDTNYKNAADIMLAVDAAEIHYSGQDIDSFCIVTHDNDFAGLVKWLRGKGAYVTVIWSSDPEKHKPSFEDECDYFILIGNLPDSRNQDPEIQKKLLGWKDAVRKVIKEYANEEGWVLLSEVGNKLKSIGQGFDPHDYCHSKLSSLIKSCSEFETETGPERVKLCPQKP